jgi:hypothetical protein
MYPRMYCWNNGLYDMKCTPYYAHIEYNAKTDPNYDTHLPDEDVKTIDEIPVYSINKRKPESLDILKLLSNIKGPKNRLLKLPNTSGLTVY